MARILIVEDDMIIAANLSLQLSQLSYEITGIESRAPTRGAPTIRLIAPVAYLSLHFLATFAPWRLKIRAPRVFSGLRASGHWA